MPSSDLTTVTARDISPVKAHAGIRCAGSTLDARALQHDRGWMLTDGYDKFVTQREHPHLALIAPHHEADTLPLMVPEGQAVIARQALWRWESWSSEHSRARQWQDQS